MARSSRSSSKLAEKDLSFADAFLAGGDAPVALNVDPAADECPSCFRGRIVNNQCTRCGTWIPKAGVLPEKWDTPKAAEVEDDV